MKILYFLIGIIFFNFSSCKSKETVQIAGTDFEKIYPLFPGIEKHLHFESSKFDKIDIGIDFDVNQKNIKAEVTGINLKKKAIRIPGTTVKLSLCNISLKQKPELILKTFAKFNTVWVSIRVEKSPSYICSSSVPSQNEYLANLRQKLQ